MAKQLEQPVRKFNRETIFVAGSFQRTTMRKSVCLFLFSLAGFAQSTPPRFTLTDVGALPNSNCTPTAISANGTITGFCVPFLGSPLEVLYGGGSTSGFIYRKGSLSDLGSAPQPVVLPFAVNDAGTVVGMAASFDNIATITAQPITNSTGTLRALAGAPLDLVPLAISSRGVIAGTRVMSVDVFETAFSSAAVTFSNGQSTQLAPYGSLAEAAAIGMSPSGMVAGFSSDTTFNTVTPTIWQASTPSALPVPSGFVNAIATGVNDAGQVAGLAFHGNPSDGKSEAFWFDGKSSVDLGTLPGSTGSAALGINSSGWMVGFTNPHSGGLDPLTTIARNQKAVLWAGGSIYDLATLVNNATGWNLAYATALNDAGQIVGAGTINGAIHVFLLTPAAPGIDRVVGAGLSTPPVSGLSPNGIFTVFGSGFAPTGTFRTIQGSDIVNNALPTKLGTICVQAGGKSAGILAYTPTQVNAVYTAPVVSGNVQVSVITNCGESNQTATPALSVPAAAATPEFLFFVLSQDGKSPVAAVQAKDNSYIGPPGLIQGATFAPAHAGDIITVYVVGLGPTDPPVTPGTVATEAANASGVSVTVGGLAASVLYAGVSPTYAGLYQLNIQVPSVAPGNQPIAVSVNNVSSPEGAYLAVSQ
jgi:uncharacterized protein (TIGR03437 family)